MSCFFFVRLWLVTVSHCSLCLIFKGRNYCLAIGPRTKDHILCLIFSYYVFFSNVLLFNMLLTIFHLLRLPWNFQFYLHAVIFGQSFFKRRAIAASTSRPVVSSTILWRSLTVNIHLSGHLYKSYHFPS